MNNVGVLESVISLLGILKKVRLIQQPCRGSDLHEGYFFQAVWSDVLLLNSVCCYIQC